MTKHVGLGFIVALSALVIPGCADLEGDDWHITDEDRGGGNVLKTLNYENGTFHDEGNGSSLCCGEKSAKVVTNPPGRGGKVGWFHLDDNDQGQVSIDGNGTYGPGCSDPVKRSEAAEWGTSQHGDARWWGFTHMIPKWSDDTNDPNGTIVAQWHNNGDDCDNTRSPHLSLAIMPNDHYRATVRYNDTDKCNGKLDQVAKHFDLGPIEIGQWQDWVLNVEATHKGSGFVKIWRNGEVALDYHGPTSFNDDASTDNFFKWGIYKSWLKWMCDHSQSISGKFEGEIYYDDIRYADGSAGYDAVAPNGSSNPEPEPEPEPGPSDGPCFDQFGDVDGFALCGQTADTCSFNANKNSAASCDDICLDFGGSCLTAYDNGNDLCAPRDEVGCGLSTHVNDICVCTMSEVSLIDSATPTAASSEHASNQAHNTLDGSLNTRWSAEGDGEWIRYDLGGSPTIAGLSVAWHKGDERSASFDAQLSDSPDGPWTTIFSGQSSGETRELEDYAVSSADGRFLRLVGHGNDSSGWNSITEVRAVGG